MKNIVYSTDQIEDYFSKNRITWDDFYKSERDIFDKLFLGKHLSVLDIGCGCGGLGLALKERFGVSKYTGVEINQQATKTAKKLNPQAKIYEGDFLGVRKYQLCDQQFDVVFSLSCFDWNLEFSEMLNSAWTHVAPGGNLVATFRIVPGLGCDDMKSSYQYINYQGIKEGEIAAYVVLNASELFQKLLVLDPIKISAAGYFGPPSSTAITPYSELCFCAISVTKRKHNDLGKVEFMLDLPGEILKALSTCINE